MLPNPSGRNRAYPGFEKKLVWYRALADTLGHQMSTMHCFVRTVQEESTCASCCAAAVLSTVIEWLRDRRAPGERVPDRRFAFRESGAFHRAGQLDRAAQLYRELLARAPEHADAMFLLSVIALQTSRLPEAAALLEQAVRVAPNNSLYTFEPGVTFIAAWAEALEALTVLLVAIAHVWLR